MDATIAKNKYKALSEHGSRLNLSFSGYLDLGKQMIAFDGIQKRLLVLDTSHEPNHTTLIDLNEVAAVVVKKYYGSIDREELNYKGLGHFLERIDLAFELTGEKETVALTFYDCGTDGQGNLRKLEQYADNWKMMLTKIVGTGTKSVQTAKHIF